MNEISHLASIPISTMSSQNVPSPIRTKQASIEVQGVSTQVVAEAFQDRVLILVTQLGKIGSLTQASLPINVSLPPPTMNPPIPPLPALPEPHASIALVPLMGTSPSPLFQPVYEMYVSQLASIVWHDEGEGGSRRPVVVGLALKPLGNTQDGPDWAKERERFGKVMELAFDCRVW